MPTPEGQIKALIMDWLRAQPGCYARTIQLGGIGKRTNNSKGISDIIGVWRSRFLAIEVKTSKGKVSEEQQEFLDCVNRCGGIAFVAKSLEDVLEKLQSVTNA